MIFFGFDFKKYNFLLSITTKWILEQINQAETRIFKTVFPNTTNHYDIWRNSSFMMDEVAYYCHSIY
jgi:hypothetical protein